LECLIGHSRNALVVIAQGRAPKTGAAVEITVKLVVDDVDAVAMCDDRWANFKMLQQVGLWVQDCGLVALSVR
jgi:hypothetical protein